MMVQQDAPRRRRERRDVHGIVLLDKPAGLSSNLALQIVRGIYGARKAGHGGSLDPLATGLLPLLFGEATKVSGRLLEATKGYRFTARLGITTSTGDAEGAVLEERPVERYDRAVFETVFERFRGEILQVPPMHSALKREGQPLYRLARKGVEVEREPRPVTIHALTLLGWDDTSFTADVRCSKGTYIRTLAVDIGAALGCGAHVVSLRRTEVAPYDATRMVTLEALRECAENGGDAALDAWLLPIDSALVDWPEVRLGADAAHYFVCGNAVQTRTAPRQGWVRVYADDGRFVGLGEVLDDGRVAPRRVLLPGAGA